VNCGKICKVVPHKCDTHVRVVASYSRANKDWFSSALSLAPRAASHAVRILMRFDCCATSMKMVVICSSSCSLGNTFFTEIKPVHQEEPVKKIDFVLHTDATAI
jgi:hypothetical protein